MTPCLLLLNRRPARSAPPPAFGGNRRPARSAPPPAFGLAVAAASLGLAACVGDGDATVVIIQNQAPDEGCVIAATPSDRYIGAGRIDLAEGVNGGYLLTPVAENLAMAADSSVDRTAFVEGIRVDLHFPADQALEDEFWNDADRRGLVRFEIPYAAPISPGGTTSFIAEVVPEELLEVLQDDVAGGSEVLILANVRLVGHLGDGGGFESSNFRYPVEVCSGCLIENLGSCGTIAPGSTIDAGGVCNPYQDFALDCCVSVNGDTLCPAVPE